MKNVTDPAHYGDEVAHYGDEVAHYGDEVAHYEDEVAHYGEEVARWWDTKLLWQRSQVRNPLLWQKNYIKIFFSVVLFLPHTLAFPVEDRALEDRG